MILQHHLIKPLIPHARIDWTWTSSSQVFNPQVLLSLHRWFGSTTYSFTLPEDVLESWSQSRCQVSLSLNVRLEVLGAFREDRLPSSIDSAFWGRLGRALASTALAAAAFD